MADLSQMSDADLAKLAGQSDTPAVARDFSHISDEELERIASSPAPPQGQDAGVLSAFGRGVANAMTLGGYDWALTNALPSSLAMRAKANIEETAQDHPLANLLGNVAGALGGGIEARAVGTALRGAGAAGRVLSHLASPLALKEGQTVKNAARMAATGALTGGITSLAEGDDAQHAALSAGASALAAPVVGTAVTALAPYAGSASARAWGILAKKLDADPATLSAAYTNMSHVLKRPVPLTALMGAASRGELKDIAAANPELAENFTRAAENPAQDGVTLNKLAKDRDANFTAAVDPIRDQGLRLSPDDIDYLKSDVMPNSGISQLFRRKLAQGLDNAQITIGDADTLRQRFWAQAASKPGEGFDEVAKDLSAFAEQRSPEYSTAMQNYRDDSDYLDGFSQGLKGGKIADAKGLLRLTLDKPKAQAGYAVGQMAKRERDNIASVVPGSLSSPDEAAQLAHAAGGALAHSPAIAAYHITKATADKLKLPPSAVPQVAKMLSDPNMTQRAIQLLKQAGARNSDIRDLAIGTIIAGSANSGPTLGGVAGSQLNQYIGQ